MNADLLNAKAKHGDDFVCEGDNSRHYVYLKRQYAVHLKAELSLQKTSWWDMLLDSV